MYWRLKGDISVSSSLSYEINLLGGRGQRFLTWPEGAEGYSRTSSKFSIQFLS